MVHVPSVAVIDVGSNSIKLLVATRDPAGGLRALHEGAVDARISAGIGSNSPRLSEEGMRRGIDAIRSLVGDAARHSPAKILMLGTSAVRDAQNGPEFCRLVREQTGVEMRVPGGDEEARLVGRGLLCDPALRQAQDFQVFDLGGGSLECLSFRKRCLEQALSLQLGCVRLMERFVPDPGEPLPAAAVADIGEHTRRIMGSDRFRFMQEKEAIAVATGGTAITARAVLGGREGLPFGRTSPVLGIDRLHELLKWTGAMPLADRRRVPGLPPARADVFPTALAILIALADLGGIPAYHNSLFNLRFGVADEALPPA